MTFQNLASRAPQLGSKRVCVSCSTRFYDMTKAPPVCPKCGTVQPQEVPRVRAPVREPRRAFRTPVPVAAEIEEDAAPLAETEEEDEAEIDEAEDEDHEAAPIMDETDEDL